MRKQLLLDSQELKKLVELLIKLQDNPSLSDSDIEALRESVRTIQDNTIEGWL